MHFNRLHEPTLRQQEHKINQYKQALEEAMCPPSIKHLIITREQDWIYKIKQVNKWIEELKNEMEK